MKKAAVVIPIYKEVLSLDELFSLSQGLRVLKNHQILFICPESLNTLYFEQICKKHLISPLFIRFADSSFTSVASYNRLLLEPSFYEKFSEYDYILIYQLDALVFSDKLIEWCEKGYDYLGAPWFKDISSNNTDPIIQEFCGNGGFSLRNVKSTLTLLTQASTTPFSELKCNEYKANKRYIKAFISRFKTSAPILDIIRNENMQEDVALSHYLPRFFNFYKVADSRVASHFAFEEYPERLFELTGKTLPFGCHAFCRFNLEFWKSHSQEVKNFNG